MGVGVPQMGNKKEGFEGFRRALASSIFIFIFRKGFVHVVCMSDRS